MAFPISQGLFALDIIDFYAILGVPVTADVKELRKRYLVISRSLHPDSRHGSSPGEMQLATDWLAQMVNPAYKRLTDEKERAEYNLILKLKAKQCLDKSGLIRLAPDQHLPPGPPGEAAYLAKLSELAQGQYETLGEVVKFTGQISEVNLAFLLWQQEGIPSATVAPRVEPRPVVRAAASEVAKATTNDINPRLNSVSYAEEYCRRAEELIGKNQFAAALQEVRDGLKIDPGSVRCLILEGKIHLLQNQLTLARIYFDRALKVDPQNPEAADGRQQVERRLKAAGAAKTPTPPPKDNKPNGGLFGGLFGGKRK